MGRVRTGHRQHFSFLDLKLNTMEHRLKCIMLIDDDRTTNFFHAQVIKRANCAETVVVKQYAEDALAYLVSLKDDSMRPDLILLDVNMPRMNGWEFLEQYKLLPEEQKAKIVIVMLTTSLNPADRDKAQTINEISEFAIKPLDPEMLHALLIKHFDSPKQDI